MSNRSAPPNPPAAASALPSESCPSCKTDYYLNPSMRILVSPCYHKLCESCVNRIFGHGPAGCPECNTILRKNNWAQATFEDLTVERECRIRKRVAAIFNQREDDFEDLRSYNDYLEEVEEIVFNLVNNVNVQETDAKLELYRQRNQELILKNQTRQMLDRQEFNKQMEQERANKERVLEEAWQELQLEESSRQKREAEFIETLATVKDLSSLVGGSGKHVKKMVSSLAEQTLEMPTLKGLKKARTAAMAEDDMQNSVEPFDPLETLHQPALPFEWPIPISLQFIRVPNFDHEKVSVRAGGFNPSDIIRQSLLAAFTWGFPILQK